MTITINLSPEEAERLDRQARRAGQDLPSFVHDVLKRASSDDETVVAEENASESDMAVVESQEEMQKLANDLVTRLDSDFTVLPPRSGDNNGRPILAWLEQNRDKFVSLLTDILTETAASRNGNHRGDLKKAAARMLPEVEPELRVFALGRSALRWGADRYPNSVDLGRAVSEDGGRLWIVPLEHRGTRRIVGRVVLDNEGNVLPEESTTRQDAREALVRAA